MESQQFNQLLVTRPIKFIVGRGRMEYFIHSGFVSRLSVPLLHRVEKSLEGCVTWEDVDDNVFSCFTQFVYTGTYTSFVPVERDSSVPRSEGATTITLSIAEKQPDSVGLFGGLSCTGSPFRLPYSLVSYTAAAEEWETKNSEPLFGKTSSRISNKRRFDAMTSDYPESESCPSVRKRDRISAFIAERVFHGDVRDVGFSANISRTKQAPPTVSLEHVFISHVKIWGFASEYTIISLMDFACAQLACELAQWTISASAFVAEFGGLVRYVYGHTARRCQLRLLVAQFAACVVPDVSDLDGWSVLLDETPEFAVDLVHQMTNRFS
ncbi:hypothetical protein GE09DRAFT_1098717 [Coniochaeta sp. 2T2.1]|nr:hypothetical protein GE09DRAFT_1151539 [Coniochaeta sp. 2T2.1]KAB5572217.1 hypothetical protein GE09DRAFT_1098717 [Coniochaeta sp. 2T2.1]